MLFRSSAMAKHQATIISNGATLLDTEGIALTAIVLKDEVDSVFFLEALKMQDTKKYDLVQQACMAFEDLNGGHLMALASKLQFENIRIKGNPEDPILKELIAGHLTPKTLTRIVKALGIDLVVYSYYQGEHFPGGTLTRSDEHRVDTEEGPLAAPLTQVTVYKVPFG